MDNRYLSVEQRAVFLGVRNDYIDALIENIGRELTINFVFVDTEEELIENIDKYFRTLVSDKRIFANEVLEHYKKHQPKSPTTALTAQLEKLGVENPAQFFEHPSHYCGLAAKKSKRLAEKYMDLMK